MSRYRVSVSNGFIDLATFSEIDEIFYDSDEINAEFSIKQKSIETKGSDKDKIEDLEDKIKALKAEKKHKAKLKRKAEIKDIRKKFPDLYHGEWCTHVPRQLLKEVGKEFFPRV